jgi:predicted GIY-YIG superfamily endonuclease
MIFEPVFPIRTVWLHDGTLEDAIEWRDRIDEAPDVGYVYLLSYANGHTKIGATANFPERLSTHQREARRWGVKPSRCMVTRPAFNYGKIERAVKRQFDHTRHFGEVFIAPITEIANFVQFLPLARVAPDGYGRSRLGAHQYLTRLMAEFHDGLGLNSGDGMQRYVQTILDRHVALGRATGLSEQDAIINALAVIEAHTGLDLSVFHTVLKEAA